MEYLSLTEARRELPSIINEAQSVEVGNRKNRSIILPKKEYEKLLNRMDAFVSEMADLHVQVAIHSSKRTYRQEEVERMLMEEANDQMD